MKKNDILLVAIVVVISGAFSLVITSLFFNPTKKQMTAEVVVPISSDFNVPKDNDPYFNKQSVNPTQPIQIGNGTNNQPAQ